MLDCQEQVCALVVKIHDDLVTKGFIKKDDDELFDALLKSIDEFADFPDYRNYN